MKKVISLIFIISLTSFICDAEAQNQDIDLLFQAFARQYNIGDLLEAENTLSLILNFKNSVPLEYEVAVYNNLGATSTLLGRYQTALEYYSSAEDLLRDKKAASVSLADIYNNKAHIYNLLKSYDLAIDYLERSIRIYLQIDNQDKRIKQSLSSAYLNYGITFLETKNYKYALTNFIKSTDLKLNHKLPGLGLAFLNSAKAYVNINDQKKAEEFFLKSIASFKNEFSADYFRLPEVYLEYGLFLNSVGKIDEALEAHGKALDIAIKNYGNKHLLVSYICKFIGDDYLVKADIHTALIYYQKSLIAVSPGFDNTDIFSNPPADSSLFDIRLLDNLKSKAQALSMLAEEKSEKEERIVIAGKGLETIELALQLIDKIRSDYMSEESRIYLAENEKETYLFATLMAANLFDLTGSEMMMTRMYEIASRSKAANLRNEITENELFYSSAIPDSLRQKQNNLSSKIAAYNNLILEESRKPKPDSVKIVLWKDALFDMNREKERVTGEIAQQFPRYYDIIRKTAPLSADLIRKKLKKDETIVDYLLSNQYHEGKRKLFMFLITRDNIEFRETSLDSLFVHNALIIANTADPSGYSGQKTSSFEEYAVALNYMYINLVKPAEDLIKGDKLIIIPDEEIGLLPFDAFIRDMPSGTHSDWENLSYLIHDYTFSYAYSSSLIFDKSAGSKRGAEVFSFSPDYGNGNLAANEPEKLQGAEDEIRSIYQWFGGKSFRGSSATKASFLKTIDNPGILHLAMHSMSDSTNSRYSYLLFDSRNNTVADNRLYNYEISMSRINSPMVVLSACNSGTGTLYYGEGLMSLARGFILAGASSVVKTAWAVNDEASSEIISRFYKHLSYGKAKNEAMRSAKLDYLSDALPAYANPLYWAAYEVMGDNTPVSRRNITLFVVITVLIVIIACSILLLYRRRRRIFSERSR